MQDLNQKTSWSVLIVFAIIIFGIVGYACWMYKIDMEKESSVFNIIATPTSSTSPSVSKSSSKTPSNNTQSGNIYKVNYSPTEDLKFSFQFEINEGMVVVAKPVYEGPRGLSFSFGAKDDSLGYVDAQLIFNTLYENNGSDTETRDAAKQDIVKNNDGANFKDIVIDGAPGFSYDILGFCRAKATEFFKSGYKYELQTGCMTDIKLYNKVLDSFKFVNN